jgi:phosphate ABC transporter phosphate-binding protein
MPYWLVTCLLICLTVSGCGPSPPTVTGRGSTLLEPLMKVWIAEYRHTIGNSVRIRYVGTGSADGVARVQDRLADFGGTEIPLTATQVASFESAGRMVVAIPLVVSAVVPVYNLPGIEEPIVLSGPVLAAIMTGEIIRWNDSRIGSLNPAIAMPALAILPVFRSDPGGTSYLASQYLANHSEEFRNLVGVGSDPAWPTRIGIRQHKSDGVAGHVQRTVGAISLIERTFALDAGLRFASIQTGDGTIVAATIATIQRNLAGDRAGNAYPITGITWAVVSRRDGASVNGSLMDFLSWALSEDGQTWAARRNYCPLPESLRFSALEKLKTLRGASP